MRLNVLFVGFLLFFLSNFPEASAYEYEIAISAIFQNEAPYLKEWIEFHKLIGVQHFYLYNHCSNDDYLDVLAPYIASDEVELTCWGHPTKSIRDWTLVQTGAYNDVLKRTKGLVKWLAIIDIDEFIVPTAHPCLSQFLQKFEKEGCVCLNWQIYGTSEIDRIPQEEWITKHLLMKALPEYPRNSFVKSIVRPERTLRAISPHHFAFENPYRQIDSKGIPFRGMRSPQPEIDEIRINHYYTRDIRYFIEKKLPRLFQEYSDSSRFKEEWINAILSETNAVHDPAILRFYES